MNSFLKALLIDVTTLKVLGFETIISLKDFIIGLLKFLGELLIIIFLPILYPIAYIFYKKTEVKRKEMEKKARKKHMDRMFPKRK